METNPIVLDISSDEEEVNDVVVGVEDDCVVLDGDPDKHVNDELPTATAGSDDNDLFVVRHTGQVACRDYPHPRHLCANFPYDSSPHQNYCDKCHCYVCDSPAPCQKWGTGISTTDHCHATDESETWKTLRKDSKQVNIVPLPSTSTNSGTTLHLDFVSTSMNPTSRSTASHLRPLSVNPIPQNQTTLRLRRNKNWGSLLYNQDLWPITMNMNTTLSPINSLLPNQSSLPNNVPKSSTASNLKNPNGANIGRSQESRSTSMYPSTKQLLALRDHAIAMQKKRGNRVSGLGPQGAMFKGITNVDARNNVTTNHVAPRRSSRVSDQVNTQYGAAAAGISNYRNSHGQNGGATFQDVPQQKPHGNRSQNEYFLANVDARNTVTTNHVAPCRSSRLRNQVNSQYGAAATGISNYRSSHGQNGGATSQDVSQQRPHGSMSQNEDFLANVDARNTVTTNHVEPRPSSRLSDQVNLQYGAAATGISNYKSSHGQNGGATFQDVPQQRPHGSMSQNEDFLANVDARNTVTTNHVAPRRSSRVSNQVNPQYGAAATGITIYRSSHGQNGGANLIKNNQDLVFSMNTSNAQDVINHWQRHPESK